MVKALFEKTLKSIQSSKYVDNIEVVVVDDGRVDRDWETTYFFFHKSMSQSITAQIKILGI